MRTLLCLSSYFQHQIGKIHPHSHVFCGSFSLCLHLRMYHNLSILMFTDIWDIFCYNSAVDVLVHVFWYIGIHTLFFGYAPRSGNTGS